MFAELLADLRAWDRRRRWLRLAIVALRGAAAGGVVAALTALLARWRPWLTTGEVGTAGLIVILVGAWCGALLGWGRRRTPLQQARWADGQLGLQERLSTAVEIGQGKLAAATDFGTLQLVDALQAAHRVDIRQALPWRWPRREGVWLLVAMLAWGVAWLAPNPQAARLAAQRAAAAQVAAEIQTVSDLIAALQADPTLEPAQREALLAPLNTALAQLQTPDITPLAALAALSEAEATLQTLADDMVAGTTPATVTAAGSALAATALGAAWQTGDPAQAAAATQALAADLSAVSPADQEALAQGLQAAAEAISADAPSLAVQLAQAADALRQGDLADAGVALRDVAAALHERAARLAAAQGAQIAADQLATGRQALAQASQADQAATQPASGLPGDQVAPGGESQSADVSGDGQSDAGGSGGGSNNQAGADGGSGGPSRGGGHVEQVYAPPPLDLSDADSPLLPLPARCQVDPTVCDQLAGQRDAPFRPQDSLVPYTQVFGDYRDQAATALADEHIPLGLKAYIRDYFSALEP